MDSSSPPPNKALVRVPVIPERLGPSTELAQDVKRAGDDVVIIDRGEVDKGLYDL